MRFDERPVTEADLEQLWELEREAFDADPARADLWKRWALEGGTHRWQAVFDGSRCAAMARVLPLRQWFGGRSVAMGGVAAVAVRPEYRRRGCARRVIRSCLAGMRARGEVISALFPSVVPPYRGLGWEVAGLVTYHTVATRALAAIRAPDVTIRRGGAVDLDVLRSCYDRVARATDGFLDRPEAHWRWLLDRRGGDLLYLAGDDGYVIYRHAARPEIGPGVFHLVVSQLVAATPEALRALWGMLGAPASPFVPSVTFRGAPYDPLRLLLPTLDVRPVRERYWMLRLVDAAGAIAARGYPAGVRAAVPLEITDPECSANQGRFVLVVDDGRASLEPGGSGAIRLGAGALASLYSGWATTAVLDRTGLLAGGSEAERAQLDLAFAGPTPWMLDEF